MMETCSNAAQRYQLSIAQLNTLARQNLAKLPNHRLVNGTVYLTEAGWVYCVGLIEQAQRNRAGAQERSRARKNQISREDRAFTKFLHQTVTANETGAEKPSLSVDIHQAARERAGSRVAAAGSRSVRLMSDVNSRSEALSSENLQNSRLDGGELARAEQSSAAPFVDIEKSWDLGAAR